MSITWKELGSDYPGMSPCARAAFDAIAPVVVQPGTIPLRCPGFDLGTELPITPEMAWNLALRASNAVLEKMLEQRITQVEVEKSSRPNGRKRETD